MDTNKETREFVDFEQFRQTLKICDPGSFQLYTKEIYRDLADRSESKKSGISKLTFMEYMKLPVFICEKVFMSFDMDKDSFLNLKEFTEGMSNLYLGSFEETAKIIFNIYDIDKDGVITIGDVRILLSFLPLKTDKTKTEYKYQMESLEEINEIITQTFNKKSSLKYTEFIDIIEKKKSDIYIQLLCFLFQRKPFNEESIKSYKSKEEKKRGSAQIEKANSLSPPTKQNKQLLSPSRHSVFSPAESLLSITLLKLDENQVNTDSPNSGESNKLPLHQKKMSFNDKGMAPEMSGYKGMIRMANQKVETEVTPQGGKKEIKKIIETSENVFNSPSNFLKKQKQVIPEFSLEDKLVDMNGPTPITKILEEKDKILNSTDVVTMEDYIYKLSENGKLKKYYLVLNGKDIYYYKTNLKDDVQGMHNLSGTFVQENGEKKIADKVFYSFSIIFNSKTRNYYCPDKSIAKLWTANLRSAIGYHNFFDFYEMLDEIGEGKFGLVKLGVHYKTKERVAIKIIKKEAMNASDMELVKGEIDIMKLCRHPNVVRLLDHFENSEYIFIVMEYLSGGDLGNHLQVKNFTFTEKRASEIMYQIANGLNYLHSYGVLHRDLKPDNIMLSDNTENATIKIMDFGLSKILAPQERVNDGFGTLSFVAPEVLIRQPYNKQIDIWSMGVILYYMLTGCLPFDDENDSEEIIAKMIVFNEVAFPDKLWKNRSSEVIDIIGLCLIKNPDKRVTIDTYLQHDWITKHSSST